MSQDPAIKPLVGIIMGSSSDWPTMQNAAQVLQDFGVPFEKKVVSAHRTPQLLYDYATTASQRGLKCIIAGAGGAAHLPGMTASMTTLPVLGVPVQSRALSGTFSRFSARAVAVSLMPSPFQVRSQAGGGSPRPCGWKVMDHGPCLRW